ncbi:MULTISPECIES: tetratricopeptide repeat protein [unclassified Thioalkalivibrio]|uniref:tetratricopeptide repeat protein n=1 Tax=unclassified Thioalkalivibrio TaxID=2621013 RepID=UPI000370F6FB|nr:MULTISPECIES: SEL1-like repeat protein [unclassified Thioalkalivibrio]
MHWISIDTAMRVTGLARRTLWRRVAGHPEWKRNLDEPLQRALIAVDALRSDLLFDATEDDLAVLVAADRREPESMNDLALLLLEAGHPESALEWLSRAAKKDHPDAMHWLGRCYISGEGCIADRSEGLAWLQRSAKKGHVISARQLDALASGLPSG